MAAITYNITNIGETTITSLDFLFTTPAEVELHADLSTIKVGAPADFTGTTYTVTGLTMLPLDVLSFSVNYTYLTGSTGVYYGSIDVTGNSASGSSAKLISTTVNLTIPPPYEGIPIPNVGYTCVPSASNLNDTNNVAWYAGTLATAMSITFDTTLSDPGSDTVIGVYDSSGNLLGSDHNSGAGSLSSITLNLAAGDYYVAVGHYPVTFNSGWYAVGTIPLVDDCSIKLSVTEVLPTVWPDEIAVQMDCLYTNARYNNYSNITKPAVIQIDYHGRGTAGMTGSGYSVNMTGSGSNIGSYVYTRDAKWVWVGNGFPGNTPDTWWSAPIDVTPGLQYNDPDWVSIQTVAKLAVDNTDHYIGPDAFNYEAGGFTVSGSASGTQTSFNASTRIATYDFPSYDSLGSLFYYDPVSVAPYNYDAWVQEVVDDSVTQGNSITWSPTLINPATSETQAYTFNRFEHTFFGYYRGTSYAIFSKV